MSALPPRPDFPRPEIEAVRSVLARVRPDLAGVEITYLDAGWDFWAFAAGDYVLRCPKREIDLDKLDRERRLLPELAPSLPLHIPAYEIYTPDGPNGRLLIGHRRIPGVALRDLPRRPADGFGAALGRYLRALHDFPVERARALGLELRDGASARAGRILKYERFVRRIFPMLSCETRTYIERVFTANTNDPAGFAYEPCLVHLDIDDRNVLADPVTGELTGVIDFSDALIGPPAADFDWAYCFGFEAIGIADQIVDLLREGGIEESALAGRREFLSVWWPLDEIEHGLDIGDEEIVDDAMRRLNAAVPHNIVCV